jgi:hypothetical protein
MPSDLDAGPSALREDRRPVVKGAGGPTARRWQRGAAGFLGGVLAAVLGTALHAQVLRIGEVAVPLGAAAALVLAGSIVLWCGLWARSPLISALSGGTAYLVVALLSLSSETVILSGTEGPGPEPSAVLAGNLWMFGLALATVAAVGLCAAALRGPRPE